MSSNSSNQIVIIGKVPDDLGRQLERLGQVQYVDRNESLSEDEIIAASCKATVLLTEPPDRISPAVIAACPDLVMIAQRAVGYDNIDLKDCVERPILVSNTPGVLDNATADLAFALLLAAGRRIVEADKYVRSGQWLGFENDLLLGTEMTGATIGIIGMGRIGSAMARRARGFGMRVIYCRSTDKTGEADAKDKKWLEELGAERMSMDEVLKASDYISVHCPHNKQTERLIGAREFGLMKSNCIFVNTARGKVVDEDALCQAISGGKIRGVGLDVFYNEPKVSQVLLDAPNVVLAPHIGSASEETRYAMAKSAVDAVLTAFDGKLPANVLNGDLFGQWREKIQARVSAK